MHAFENWLEKEISISKTICLVILISALCLICYLVLGNLVNYPFNWFMLAPIRPYSAFLITKNAFGEEAVFRLIPIAILTSLLNKNNPVFYLIIFFIALFFAYCHLGIISLIVIGPISIMLTVAYLKFGGYSNKHLKAFLITGSIHSIVNLSLHGIGMLLI